MGLLTPLHRFNDEVDQNKHLNKEVSLTQKGNMDRNYKMRKKDDRTESITASVLGQKSRRRER